MKKLFLFVTALSVCALAAESSLEERVDGLTAQVDRVLSKAGIHFGGEFRSQFLNSTVDGDAVSDANKVTESAEYTSVDFDIVARPNSALSARAVFRLHQDWRIFFSDVQNPITTRWLSIDGSLLQGMFKYNFGDYKKKLTPLTLWSPDLEFLYEPDIFAQGRQLAMSEAFLGENNRLLQGVNLEFKAEVYPILQELSVDVFGARLATRGTFESGVISTGVAPNKEPDGEYWDNNYDNYLVGVNLATQVIKGAGFGVSNISIFDNVDSYYEKVDGSIIASNELNSKLYSKSNNIFAGRVNVDNSAFMADDFVHFGLNAEVAFSAYKDYGIDSVALGKAVNYADTLAAVVERPFDGMAINAGLSLKFNLDESNAIGLSADYILNDSAFVNEAAQSPSFLQKAILNNENDLAGLGLLNPFDALYRSVFKYTPSQTFGGAKPYTKNAYINSILPRNVNDTIFTGKKFAYPNVFQAALPGGLATADRTGPVLKLDGTFLDNAISVGGKVAMLKSVTETPKREIILYDTTYIPVYNDDDPSIVIDPGQTITEKSRKSYAAFNTDFQEIVVGASFDIAKFAPAVGPSLLVGGSYGMYSVIDGDLGSSESALLSAFLNYNFFKGFSLLFGYQQLGTSLKDGDVETVKYSFGNMAFGLGYKVTEAGSLTVKYTMLSGKAEPKGGTAVDYAASQPEVYLTVRF